MKRAASDRIAADVKDAAAADIGLIAHIRRVGVEIGEQREDGAHFAEFARSCDLPRPQPLRVIAHHESFGDEDAVGHGAQPLGILRVEAHRLFAEHVLAGLRGGQRQVDMQMVRQRIVDRVDLGVGQHLLVGAVGVRDAELVRRFARPHDIARCDRRRPPSGATS